MSNKSTTNRRIAVLLLLATLIFTSLIGRLYYLQVVKADAMREKSKRQREYVEIIPPTRGWILDRNHNPLAINSRSMKYTILVDKKYMAELTDSKEKDIRGTIQRIGLLLGMSDQEMQRHIDFLQTKQAREIVRGVSENLKEAFEIAKIPGVIIRAENTRFYPEGTLAAHVVGFTGSDGNGLSGLEYSLNEKLMGDRIVLRSDTDPGRTQPITHEDLTKEFKRGADAILTIDSYIQYIVEREIKKVCIETNALRAHAVVMHPKSGEILAMANYPTFDPNIRDASPEYVKNALLTDVFEPGSVIKPFIVAAALDKGTVTPEQIFFCENGGFYFRGHRIRDDVHSFGYLSVSDILVRSSNIGTVKVALTLGKDYREQASVIVDYFKRFGFKHVGDSKTTYEIPGESVGVLRPPQAWNPAEMGAVPFGQAMSTNTLILTAAYSAIANRGLYVQPYIIHSYRGKSGYLTPERPRPTRIVDSQAMEKVVDMLVGVTEDPEGTGYRHVRIPGFHIAGKTGTAQKVDPQKGTYGYRMRIGSFCGFFPAEDPQLCITVVVDEPKGSRRYGGETAGAAWRKISEEIIAYWGMSPTVLNDPKILEETQKRIAAAKRTKKAEPETPPKTYGVNLVKPIPLQNDIVVLQGQMPSLEGLPMRDASLTLIMNGLKANFEGSGKVVKQEIAAGTIIEGTDYVGTIHCEPMLTDPTVHPPSPQLVKADVVKK